MNARIISAVIATLVALGCEGGPGDPAAPPATGGNAERGEAAILAYGCGACHVIPGIRGARGEVGPPLNGFARRTFIHGSIPNAPDSLARFLVDPRALAPGTAMPALGLTQSEARDVASYLYTLD